MLKKKSQKVRRQELIAHLAALRPRQWTKNLITLAAPLFAFEISLRTCLGSLMALVLFCATSSSFYLFNDIADVKSDRLHPDKCKRPIASGVVSISTAIVMGAVLLGSALTIGWLRTPALGLILSSYAVLQIAYNLKLKHIVLLDVIAIATGFVLRASAGAAATAIPLSPWFLLCTAMLALFLGIEKRKAELQLLQIQGGKTRRVLQFYSLELLARMENVVTTGAVVTYAIWSAGPVVNGAATPWMMLTLPFVIYGIFRYQLLSEVKEANLDQLLGSQGGQTERPDEVLLKDKPLLLTVVGWVVTIFFILLLNQRGMLSSNPFA